jgi:anti-anti-sigma regulatory factor
MAGATLDVGTSPDGTVIVHPRGSFGAEEAVELRRTLVHAVRRLRPLRLVVDLHDLSDLDSINLGTLAAAWQLGDDHRVAVFFDHSSLVVAGRLTAAGVPGHRLRHTSLQ